MFTMEVQHCPPEYVPAPIGILAQENVASIRCAVCGWMEPCKLTDAMSTDERDAAINRTLNRAAVRGCGHWQVSGRDVQAIRVWLRRTTANPA
jgi:hypothetical protein